MSDSLPPAFHRIGTASFAEFLHASGQRPIVQDSGSLQAPHGTTIVSLVFDGGVVMAGDRRATMGNFIAQKDIQKVFEADSHSVIGIAGTELAAAEAKLLNDPAVAGVILDWLAARRGQATA